jgi:hypothetical protein
VYRTCGPQSHCQDIAFFHEQRTRTSTPSEGLNSLFVTYRPQTSPHASSKIHTNMSSSPSLRGSSREPSLRPSTPDQNRPTPTRNGSFSVAPKSEYLRNALQARRAQNTPTPSPLEARAPPPPTPKPLEVKTLKTSPDAFAEFDLTEEQTAPVSPIRRRRPSDVGPPRSKTNRELTNEIDKLKETLMTTNMRVELLKKDNREVNQNLTAARELIEQLEPLEDENYELQAENNQLRLKIEKMDEEIAHLRDDNEDQRKTNEELTAIASESAAHWAAHESAIEEAAECIIKMEEEKSLLSTELKRLKERVIALESTSPASTLVGSPAKYPSRVYSVDESRPSTSHFDSDYYSATEPGSPPPPVNASSDSVKSFTPSERSKKFLDLTEERRRSARNLVKRMSAASLKALRDCPSPPPEVPQIPTAYQSQIPSILEEDRSRTPQSAPRRHRKGRQAVPQPLMDAAQISPARPSSVAPQAPVPAPDGLRGLYRPDRSTRSRTSHGDRPSTSHVVTPTNAASFASRQQSGAEASPYVPSRGSSKYAQTGSSSEHLPRHTPRPRHSSTNLRSGDTTPGQSTPQSVSSEWATPAPSSSPPVSVASLNDLTTEVDPREDKERWWRSMDRLTLSQVMAQQVQQTVLGGQHSNTLRAENQYAPPPPRGLDTSVGSGGSGTKSRTAPSTAVNSPYGEQDFLFNANESEEDFLRKARSGGPRRLP